MPGQNLNLSHNRLLPHPLQLNIVTILRCFDYRWGMDCSTDLLTTYTNNSELQVITALSLICTLYKSLQHPLSLFPACCVFISHSLATASNSGDYSASRALVVFTASRAELKLSQLTTNWVRVTLRLAVYRQGSVVYNCCWSSPAQSFSGQSPSGFMTFYCLIFDTPRTWRARSTYLYPPGTGWPSYTPRHWVPFSSHGPCGRITGSSQLLR
jgi:hypothetical protein